MTAKPCHTALLCAVALTAISSAAHATPCGGIDRSLGPARRTELETRLARELHVKKADIVQSFKKETWSILYVRTPAADETFLFYNHNPSYTQHIAQWSGAAKPEEENAIKAWTLGHAAGIPESLADCFAWHVTRERDK